MMQMHHFCGRIDEGLDAIRGAWDGSTWVGGDSNRTSKSDIRV